MKNRILIAVAIAAFTPLGFALAQSGSSIDVSQQLNRAGYTEVREVEFDDGLWEAEVRRADGRWGEVHVDPASGEVFDRDGALPLLDAAGISAALSTQGYVDIDDLDRDGAVWSADARDASGQRVDLRIAGTDGRVLHVELDNDNDD